MQTSLSQKSVGWYSSLVQSCTSWLSLRLLGTRPKLINPTRLLPDPSWPGRSQCKCHCAVVLALSWFNCLCRHGPAPAPVGQAGNDAHPQTEALNAAGTASPGRCLGQVVPTSNTSPTSPVLGKALLLCDTLPWLWLSYTSCS